MTRWHVESVVQLAKPAAEVKALAVAGDDVQIAAIANRSLYVGLLGPSGFPAPLLPTGVTTDTDGESVDANVRGLWETLDWRELSAARQLQWTPDGTALWVAGQDAVVLYDVAGAVIRALPRKLRVGAIAQASNEDLVLGLSSYVVRIEPEKGDLRRKLSGHESSVTVWAADTDLRYHRASYSLYVTAVDVVHDGRILSGSEDGTVRLWPGPLTSEDARVFEAGGPVVDAYFLEERRAIVASRPGPVFALDLETKERLWCDGEPADNGRVCAFALSKDRRFAAVARMGAAVRILATSTGDPVAEAPLPQGSRQATSLCFTKAPSRLLIGTADGRVALCRAP